MTQKTGQGVRQGKQKSGDLWVKRQRFHFPTRLSGSNCSFVHFGDRLLRGGPRH